MSLVCLRVDWLAVLVHERCDQRSRDGKVNVRWVYNSHLTLIVACTCLYGLVVGIGLDKAMNLVRVDVFQVVLSDLHPWVFQYLFRRDSFVCLFMKQLL